MQPDQNCPLTRRQLTIIEWMALGKTAKEIAGLERITVNTVNSYVRTACLDTGAIRSTGLVAIALRKGWIS